MGQIRVDTVVIASSGTDSTILKIEGDKYASALRIPAAFTSTSVTFKSGTSEADMSPVSNLNGVVLTGTVSAGGHYILEPVDFVGIRFIQVISGSAEAAERTLTIVSTPRS